MNDSDKGVENVILCKLPLQTSAQHILPETQSQLASSYGAHIFIQLRVLDLSRRKECLLETFPELLAKASLLFD